MYVSINNLRARSRGGLGGLGAVKLTPAQIYGYAVGAGFPPATATKMTAIALKESGGNPAAYNGVGPDDSYGLWQVNMIGNLGPARLAQFGLSSKDQLLDPATNARAAYLIWAGDDKNLDRAWAINRGVDKVRYEANLPTAIAAATSAGAVVDLPAVEPSWTDSLVGLLPDNWWGTVADYEAWALTDPPAAANSSGVDASLVAVGLVGVVLVGWLAFGGD